MSYFCVQILFFIHYGMANSGKAYAILSDKLGEKV